MLRAGAARPRDFLARYGGEEFALVLPETDAAGALHLANRCREAVIAAAIEHAGSTIAPIVTLSLGVGTISPDADDDPAKFIEAVDRRLYRAKRDGRNMIVSS